MDNRAAMGTMRTSLAGRTTRRSGITLIELVIVMAIIGLIVGISYPAVANGLESVRLASATDSVASFINSAVNRSERRQEVFELVISVNSIVLHSTDAGSERALELPDGITIQPGAQEVPEADPQAAQHFILMPGGTVPRVEVLVANRRGSKRIVRLDPMTGVPRIEIPGQQQE